MGIKAITGGMKPVVELQITACICLCLYVSRNFGNRGNITHMALIQTHWKEMMPQRSATKGGFHNHA